MNTTHNNQTTEHAALAPDVLEIAHALDRMAAADIDSAPAGIAARVAASTAPLLSSAQRGRSADPTPASIPIGVARRGASGVRLLSPMRLAASVAIGAAVLGAVIAQRPATPASGGSLAADAGGAASVRVAVTGLTSADIALGEEILDILAPADLAGTDGTSPEASLTAEFWSFDAISEESL